MRPAVIAALELEQYIVPDIFNANIIIFIPILLVYNLKKTQNK